MGIFHNIKNKGLVNFQFIKPAKIGEAIYTSPISPIQAFLKIMALSVICPAQLD